MAALVPGTVGGVEQAVVGLVSALGRLTGGDDRYIVLTDPAAPDWLEPYLGPNTNVLVAGMESSRRRATKRALKPLLPALGRARAVAVRLAPTEGTQMRAIAPENPILERVMPDVVHFPYQWMHRTSAPSLFNPHDLQHLHFPEFFDRRTLSMRRAMYPLWCRASSGIEVPSAAVKRDLVAHLHVPADKIFVISRGSPTSIIPPKDLPEPSSVRAKYQLPESFILYPVQTWPHKNHLRLLEALTLLRDQQSVRMTLVCTGLQTDFWPTIQSRIRQLELDDQVRFLGRVPHADLAVLYRLAQFTVFPSLFEGGGFPLQEAFEEGSPLVCSSLPVLEEQAADAALYFDPTSVESIASALLTLHTDEALRSTLRSRGRSRAVNSSWERSARTYRALYRRLANRPLSDEDETLLRVARSQDG
jgi:glycosyltransferase involved in cell wall biosynthesis